MDIKSLQGQVDKAYKSSIAQAFKEFEENKDSILSTTTRLQEKQIKELERALGNNYFENMFKTKQDYDKFVKPILGAIGEYDLEKIKQSISKSYKDLLKPSISESLEYISKLQNDISSKMGIVDLKNLTPNKIEELKSLNSKIGQVHTDLYNNAINALDKNRKLITTDPIIPQIKNKDSTFKIDTIIKHFENQGEFLKQIAEKLSFQSDKLEIQNNLTDEQIKQVKISSKQAVKIAFMSISIAIISLIVNSCTSYKSFKETERSSNIQHQNLIDKLDKTNEILNESLDQKQILIELLQEIKIQNKLLSEQMNYQKSKKEIQP